MSRSEYYLSLSGDVKCRYDGKLKNLDNIDPYVLTPGELALDLNMLPSVTIMDMVDYLILTHSFYTGQQLKAYKSLQAYKYYESGFVQQVLARQINANCYVVVGHVRHSQKTREKVLKVWVMLLPDGSISSGHCMCMAGLGEVCSHIAAVLFFLQGRPSIGDAEDVSCTEKLALWPIPSMKSIDMVRIRDMDWARKSKEPVPEVSVPSLAGQELYDVLKSLENIAINPAVSRVKEPFAREMSKKLSDNLPDSLDKLFNPQLVGTEYEKLLQLSNAFQILMTAEEIELIEKATRNQAQNNMWFKYRAGRITASKFKMVCRTGLNKPSLSLIKGICYPQKVTFFSKQTSYGIKNEEKALKAYLNSAIGHHVNISLKRVGFCISRQHPEFGASPDGLVCCDCCGTGCIEVKCPYVLQDLSIEEFANKKDSCLVNNGGNYFLDTNHCYYYQTQLQMFVTNYKYCDFVIWSKNILLIERITYNKDFCVENISKCLDFFNYILKPEMLAKYFTKKSGVSRVETWCNCKKPDDGRPMLKCDNDECQIIWFHFDCMGIIDVPNDSWFCPRCV